MCSKSPYRFLIKVPLPYEILRSMCPVQDINDVTCQRQPQNQTLKISCRHFTDRMLTYIVIFRPHRSTRYVDSAYCYGRSSVVCRSVCHDREPCKKELNRSRCRLGCGLGWIQGTMYSIGSHWRNLANTTEPSMCGGDAALLSNYFEHLLYFYGDCMMAYGDLLPARR